MSKRVSGIQITMSCAVLALGACVSMLNAQAKPKVDVALTYTAERGNPVGVGGVFWLQGGGVEAGVTVWRGFALAGNFTGTHSDNFGPSRIPLSLITYTAGPRYRFAPRLETRFSDMSIFGEALFGGVHGFEGIFPSQSGQNSTANAFATQIGGGLDLGRKSRFAVRPIKADWIRMQLPNSTTNIQNDLRLSAGIVLRLGHTR